MVRITCPDCGEKSEFRKKELPLYGRVECENCGIQLEVIDDDPIEVQVVDESFDTDEDYEDEGEDEEASPY